MLSETFFEKLEQIQRDYFALRNSIEYRRGVKVQNFIHSIKQRQLMSFICQEYNYRRISGYAIHSDLSDYNYGDYPSEKINIAVYSCVTGGYDNIIEPLFSIGNVDYIMFTDNADIKSKKWDVRPIPQDIEKLRDNALINRFIKLHPSVVGDGYDYALYVDGNIHIISNVRNMVNAINPLTGLALHRHSSRDCIYSEMLACKYGKRGDLNKLKMQIDKYKKEGFPSHYGLLEATVILSDMHNPKSMDILDKWWKEYINSESRRDQVALPYVLWKNNIPIDDIGNLGNDVHKNPKFRKYPHTEHE